MIRLLIFMAIVGSIAAKEAKESTNGTLGWWGDGGSNTFGGTLPVVMWHGLGDTCCNMRSLTGRYQSIIQRATGAYVKSLQIGRTEAEDRSSGWSTNSQEQLQFACKAIQGDTKLRGGYNAVGFSQGGNFLRGIAEKCPNPPMRKLITIGSQHQGIYGIPNCDPTGIFCRIIRGMINWIVYWSIVQSRLVPLQYWHNPHSPSGYGRNSMYIGEINNEGRVNQQYKANFQRLQKLVLVMFNNENMVYPKESSHFGFYEDYSGSKVLPMRQTNLYKQDKIGLRALDQAGKIEFHTLVGRHLQLDQNWFLRNIVNVHLK